jgi:hypothetical protein
MPKAHTAVMVNAIAFRTRTETAPFPLTASLAPLVERPLGEDSDGEPGEESEGGGGDGIQGICEHRGTPFVVRDGKATCRTVPRRIRHLT